MKLLLVHAPYAQPGGEERIVETQARILTARGHDVVRSDGRGFASIVARTRPDVVHVHNQSRELHLSVYAAARDARVPVVQHLHNARGVCIQPFLVRDGRACADCVGRSPVSGVLHRCYRDSFALSAAAAGLQWRLRRTWDRHVTRFVAVSDAVATTMRSVIADHRLIVCHNGLDDDPLPRNPAGDEGYVLYVGRLSHEKGVDLQVDAAARLTGTRFVIAGDGPERAALARAAGTNVTFVGHLDRTALRDALARARVLVAPSRGQEPFGLSVAEAAALGVPAVVTRVGGLPEVVGDGGVVVDPFDAGALAAGISGFADAAYAHARGQTARRHYEAHFTPELFARRLLAVYDEVLGN